MASILDKDKEYPNEGLEALAKEAPEVVKKMGFNEGGVAIMIAPKEEMPEAEPMKSDEEMENDYLDFVVEESLSESEEKGFQAGNQLLFTMLQAGLIDAPTFSNLFNRATPDLVASSLRKYQQDAQMAQQASDKAANQGIAQGQQDEMAAMQMMGQAQAQAQQNEIMDKQVDHENEMEKIALKEQSKLEREEIKKQQ